MTLREIIDSHHKLFYQNGYDGTAWFDSQKFVDEECGGLATLPDTIETMHDPGMAIFLPHAATLALLYVGQPENDIWKRFMWTCDFDDDGQRVYVGGVGVFGCMGFQVHRHLRITDLWGVPVWAN